MAHTSLNSPLFLGLGREQKNSIRRKCTTYGPSTTTKILLFALLLFVLRAPRGDIHVSAFYTHTATDTLALLQPTTIHGPDIPLRRSLKHKPTAPWDLSLSLLLLRAGIHPNPGPQQVPVLPPSSPPPAIEPAPIDDSHPTCVLLSPPCWITHLPVVAIRQPRPNDLRVGRHYYLGSQNSVCGVAI